MFCNKVSFSTSSPKLGTTLACTFFIMLSLSFNLVSAQEDSPYITYDVPFQNLLKFNRFLINPTFSTVREDKSYINMFHRSQSAYYQDNIQNYFLSYSGRINDRTGLGISLYNQQEGVISNFGILANYAYGIKLSDKSNMTFGVNIPYYSSRFDNTRAITAEEDVLLNDLEDNSILSFQPGINISYGKFDFGVFAENLFDFNLKTGESLTEFNEKTYSGHIQYTHELKNTRGIFEEGRVLPLVRTKMMGEEGFIFGGGVILDLPKLGWLQGGYDSYYGVSAGTGFNLNRRLSFGYNFEKGLSNSITNLGITHEISIAYSFVPNLTENMVNRDDEEDEAYAPEEKEGNMPSNSLLLKEIEKLKRKNSESYAVIDELILRMDSLESSRNMDLENRFESVMRMVQRETKGERPDIDEKAKQIYFVNNDKSVKDENSGLAVLDEAKLNLDKQLAAIKNDGVGMKSYEKDIKIREFRNLSGISEGHYIVANVFGTKKYLENFVNTLKEQGLDVKYFTNPENDLNYVYLEHYDNSVEAENAFMSNFHGKYFEDMWIMHVDNSRYEGMATLEIED
ncbi:type IX secretion system PorP/SprF family membrane protein [Saonia flava]|uniref:Type IX secretion system PorP/SprF family membrane protein n=1 Tax=Saonia flava TaxID=523696 RepID=A0A846R104_9FLAO|nr:PorP/SprF family type IX secretion system membrane protein [Saonia flava]NJB72103.1 type IX secretion system PorP/SprF family membrane protein [Saonia flava]